MCVLLPRAPSSRYFSSIFEFGNFIHLITALEYGGLQWVDKRVVNKLDKIWPWTSWRVIVEHETVPMYSYTENFDYIWDLWFWTHWAITHLPLQQWRSFRGAQLCAGMWLQSAQVEQPSWGLRAAEKVQYQFKHSLTEDWTQSICWHWSPSQTHRVTEAG